MRYLLLAAIGFAVLAWKPRSGGRIRGGEA
jgi:hypothetical protein